MIYKLKQFLDFLAYPIYLINRRKPWRPGYFTAKKRQITKAIDQKLFLENSSLPEGYGFRIDERVIEYPWVFSRLSEKSGDIFDAGSALNHDFLIRRLPLNTKLSICTLAPEKRCYWRRGISYVFDDLRASKFRSGVFDTIVSISTIEHIGLDNTMLYTADGSKREDDPAGFRAAVREFRRLLRMGGECFISVPYGQAQVRGWFQIFNASMVQAVIDEFQPSSQEIEYFGYYPDGWRCAHPSELVEATFYDVHQATGFDADFAAGARGVVCMRLVA